MKEILNMDFIGYIDKYKINNTVTHSIILLAWLLNPTITFKCPVLQAANLRASKHGNFSSSTPGRLLKCLPKMAILRDGTKLQNVRTALLSR